MWREEALLYEAVRRAALDTLGKDDQGNKIAVLAALTRLHRLCCDPRLAVPEATAESSKLKELLQLLRELTASRHRALVFGHFVHALKLAAAALDKDGVTYQYLDGFGGIVDAILPIESRASRIAGVSGGDGTRSPAGRLVADDGAAHEAAKRARRWVSVGALVPAQGEAGDVRGQRRRKRA